MSKYNKVVTLKKSRGPLQSAPTATGWTHEGAPGYLNDVKTELFLRACGTFAGEGSFYETGKARDARLVMLTRSLAVTKDGVEWLLGFVPWLRQAGFMRTAPVLIACEAVAARLAAKMAGGNRALIAGAVGRSDEPGELVAYWRVNIGKTLPMAVKRGLSDAMARVYNEYALLKYDTESHGYRMGDVIELVRPTAKAAWQNDLYRYAIDRRHGRGGDAPASLTMVAANRDLRRRAAEDPAALVAGTDENVLRIAGMTWEDVLSLAGSTIDKRLLWEAIIPNMGYMGLLRNLRNFDKAGVSDDVAAQVAARLSDPALVARSRQFPFRFLTAYREAPSLRWAWPLDQALTLSTGNVPHLAGRTLILIDTSTSMSGALAGRSDVKRWDLSALFGLALAKACDTAEVWSFSDRARPWENIPGESLLKAMDRWHGGWFLSGGTYTAAALRQTFNGHDRVVIITDDEVARDAVAVSQSVPADVQLFTFNIVGSTRSSYPTGPRRHLLGGITDSSFSLIPVIEAGATGRWPWEVNTRTEPAPMLKRPANVYTAGSQNR